VINDLLVWLHKFNTGLNLIKFTGVIFLRSDLLSFYYETPGIYSWIILFWTILVQFHSSCLLVCRVLSQMFVRNIIWQFDIYTEWSQIVPGQSCIKFLKKYCAVPIVSPPQGLQMSLLSDRWKPLRRIINYVQLC